MTDRNLIGRKLQEHYEAVWQAGDAWDLKTSAFEQRRYDFLLTLLADRHYQCVLEIGCGSGCFTRLLAGIADRVVALDIAVAAIERARQNTAGAGPGIIELKAADIISYDLHAEGPWDLVVMSETIYCLGWLYPFFDIGWLASEIFAVTRVGGRFLLANTYGQERDYLLRPWLLHTYRDLFRNVGFQLPLQEIFRGSKDGVGVEVLTSLFTKPEGAASSNH